MRLFINKRLIVQIDVTASSHRDQIHYMTASHWSNGYYLSKICIRFEFE